MADTKAPSKGFGAEIDPVSAAIKAATDIGFGAWNTLFQQSEQKKVREFQQNIGLLGSQQQYEINRQMANAQTETERMSVLNNALAQIQIARLNNGGKSQSTALIAVAVVAVVLLIAVFVIKPKQ